MDQWPVDHDRSLGAIPDGECQVWWIDLDRAWPAASALALSEAEQARAAGMDNPRQKARYISSRNAMRDILSHYYGLHADEIDLTYAADGRLILAGDRPPRLHVSLSHSDEMAAFAVFARPIGVDIERMSPTVDHAAVGRWICSPPEYHALTALVDLGLDDRFFTLWTLKEAYGKATGQGLGAGVRDFQSSWSPANSAAASVKQWATAAQVPCTAFSLQAPPGFAAALVSLDPIAQVQCLWHRDRA